MPVGRPGVEAQIGGVPGFYASQSAQNEAEGKSIRFGSVLVDPDRWLPVKGVIAGFRVFGNSGDAPLEPAIGYRRRLVDALSIGVVGFGSSKRAEKYASYHGVRVGGEAMADVRLYAVTDWMRIRAQGAVALTRILMSGRYCIDSEGVGIDCNQDQAQNTIISGKVVGVYPTATAQLVLDFGKHQGTFDSVRLAFLASAGQMPLVLNGNDNGKETFYSFGLSLAVALGLGAPAGAE